MTRTTLRIVLLLTASIALALGTLPWAAYGKSSAEELESIYVEVPLNQSGAMPDVATSPIENNLLDTFVAEDPQARAYPISGSKAELLKARLHTQLTAMVETINVRDLHIKNDSVDMPSLYAQVVNSDPDLFYVTSGFVWRTNTNTESPTYGEIAEISPAAITRGETDPDTGKQKTIIEQAYAFTPDQANEMKASYEDAIQNALSWIPVGATDTQKAKAIHDWLLDHCSFNHAAEASSPDEYGWEPWTAYGGLVTGMPVCQGYSLAFLACMNRAGVQASYVTDRPQHALHGWNRINLDGSWYNLDVTYDDSDTYDETFFFLKSDAWWTQNLDGDGYHATWFPQGEAGENTRFDETDSWNRYTEPGSSADNAWSFELSHSGEATMTFDGALLLAIGAVVPEDTNTSLAVWTTSEASIATVDNTGLVTAGNTPGTATITCSLGGTQATCMVTVLGDISHDAFDFQMEQTTFNYTGQNQRPVLEQHLVHADSGDLVLEEGIDYTISWPEDTTSIGTKTFTVQGMGFYTGERTFTYKIVANDTSALQAALERAKKEQSGTKTSSTGSDVPKNELWVPPSVAQSLQAAIDKASQVLKAPQVSAELIGETARALQTATEAFIAAQKPGLKSATWKRLQGPIALRTMASIVQEGWSSSNVAILATSEGYWDALSASSLAGQYQAPVLLTEGTSLSSPTRAQLNRLKPTTVYICGGPAAVSTTVEKQVANMGIKVVRLAGDTAVGTACRIADFLAHPANTCIVATVDTYQDALSASPYSYVSQAPIYLCNSNGLDTQTTASIRAHGFTTAVIIGGTAAVPARVQTQLASIGCTTVTRLGGHNAYDTSSLVAAWELTQGMQPNRLAIATCTGYWDALCGAALCGKNNTVLLLADDVNRTTISSFARDHGPQILQGYVLGGPAAVSEATFTYAKKTVG